MTGQFNPNFYTPLSNFEVVFYWLVTRNMGM